MMITLLLFISVNDSGQLPCPTTIHGRSAGRLPLQNQANQLAPVPVPLQLVLLIWQAKSWILQRMSSSQ